MAPQFDSAARVVARTSRLFQSATKAIAGYARPSTKIARAGSVGTPARLVPAYGSPPVTAIPNPPSVPVMKLWFTSVPFNLARPIVVPAFESQSAQ